MLVQIDKEEFTKEVNKKAWHQTNNIIWTIILLFPLFSIPDFLYLKDYWMQVFIGRIIVVLLLYMLYNFLHSKNYNHRIMLHVAFLLLSATSALLCTIVSPSDLNIYFLLYSVVVLF
ncbi:MAG TPA: hypothetical protein VHS53_05655, partial [Mucilaginibacter sp.]|nr:hypothetical protein [Mucilaginibacter sp.]